MILQGHRLHTFAHIHKGIIQVVEVLDGADVQGIGKQISLVHLSVDEIFAKLKHTWYSNSEK